MRLIPGSEYYLCNWCPARYLTLFGRIIRMLPQDSKLPKPQCGP